jgi:hypothetical protein
MSPKRGIGSIERARHCDRHTHTCTHKRARWSSVLYLHFVYPGCIIIHRSISPTLCCPPFSSTIDVLPRFFPALRLSVRLCRGSLSPLRRTVAFHADSLCAITAIFIFTCRRTTTDQDKKGPRGIE